MDMCNVEQKVVRADSGRFGVFTVRISRLLIPRLPDLPGTHETMAFAVIISLMATSVRLG